MLRGDHLLSSSPRGENWAWEGEGTAIGLIAVVCQRNRFNVCSRVSHVWVTRILPSCSSPTSASCKHTIKSLPWCFLGFSSTLQGSGGDREVCNVSGVGFDQFRKAWWAHPLNIVCHCLPRISVMTSIQLDCPQSMVVKCDHHHPVQPGHTGQTGNLHCTETSQTSENIPTSMDTLQAPLQRSLSMLHSNAGDPSLSWVGSFCVLSDRKGRIEKMSRGGRNRGGLCGQTWKVLWPFIWC
jgi:hypothetical protein